MRKILLHLYIIYTYIHIINLYIYTYNKEDKGDREIWCSIFFYPKYPYNFFLTYHIVVTTIGKNHQ